MTDAEFRLLKLSFAVMSCCGVRFKRLGGGGYFFECEACSGRGDQSVAVAHRPDCPVPLAERVVEEMGFFDSCM